MITRHYKDYTIVVSKIDNNIGTGFRAMFSIYKSNGLRASTQEYVTYRRKKSSDVIEDVQRIIDTIG